jgi:hypothetical protein
LLIEIDTNDPDAATRTASSHAQTISTDLTLWLCDKGINHTVVPGRPELSFKSDDPSVLHAFSQEAVLTGVAATIKIRHRIAGTEVAHALAVFNLKQIAPAPAFANDVFVARDMYMAGRKVDNPVASFLITYSALQVFASFKSRSSRGQAGVDIVLRAEDSTVQIVHSKSSTGKTYQESEFTLARNNFIHAEERGRNPTAAKSVIEGLTPRFLILVGRILRKG